MQAKAVGTELRLPETGGGRSGEGELCLWQQWGPRMFPCLVIVGWSEFFGFAAVWELCVSGAGTLWPSLPSCLRECWCASSSVACPAALMSGACKPVSQAGIVGLGPV